jgi:hypothetical protein
MPLTPSQIDALPTYTAAQQLKMWQRASIEVAGNGQSSAVNGRQLNRSNADEILKMIVHWQEQVEAEAAGEYGGGNVLVRFGSES